MSEERIEAIQTRWSLVRSAHMEGRPESIADMRRMLVLRYAPAVKRYVGAIVRDNDDADELAQDVMLRLMRGDFAGADPSKGRFRDLLKTAIRNMIRNHWEKKNRRRTTDAGLDLVQDHSEQEQESDWTAAWQRSVLDHTWARMLAEEGGQPGPAYLVLKLRTEFPEASSDELADRLSKQLRSEIRPDNCRQMLRRARAKFAKHLLDEVRAGLDDESDSRVQEELASLGLLPWVRDLV
ncbi:MAG: sigma-70 family RNA polymerase sigma factor [Planctomycetaceae bacterium]|nr:sigma-70 family RNA polymerase sigma factor [Planctomycetaceae bacterium]